MKTITEKTKEINVCQEADVVVVGGGPGGIGATGKCLPRKHECYSENNIGSVSFPLISTGVYSYPIAKAAEIALGTVAAYFKEEDTTIKEVVFALFDSATFMTYSETLGNLK